eukprot:jgi/Mesen1/7606/ME000395S06754
MPGPKRTARPKLRGSGGTRPGRFPGGGGGGGGACNRSALFEPPVSAAREREPSVPWTPTPGRYLYAVCWFGHVSNQNEAAGALRSLTPGSSDPPAPFTPLHMLHTASLLLLLRMKRLAFCSDLMSLSSGACKTCRPSTFPFAPGTAYLDSWQAAVDTDHARACLGTRAVLSHAEYRSNVVALGAVQIDEFYCLGDASTSGGAAAAPNDAAPEAEGGGTDPDALLAQVAGPTLPGGTGGTGPPCFRPEWKTLKLVPHLRFPKVLLKPHLPQPSLKTLNPAAANPVSDSYPQNSRREGQAEGAAAPAASLAERLSSAAAASTAAVISLGDLYGHRLPGGDAGYLYDRWLPPLRLSEQLTPEEQDGECVEYLRPHWSVTRAAAGFVDTFSAGGQLAALHFQRSRHHQSMWGGRHFHLHLGAIADRVREALRSAGVSMLFVTSFAANEASIEALQARLIDGVSYPEVPITIVTLPKLNATDGGGYFRWARDWIHRDFDSRPTAVYFLEQQICAKSSIFIGIPNYPFSLDTHHIRAVQRTSSCLDFDLVSNI